MKKLLSSCVALAIICLLGIGSLNVFAKPADKTIKLRIRESFKVTLNEGGLAGVTWDFENSNPDVIKFEYETVKKIEGNDDMLIPHTWKFEALEVGTATIKFKPSSSVVGDEVTYKIKVGSEDFYMEQDMSEPLTREKDAKNFDKSKFLFIEEITNRDGVELTSGDPPSYSQGSDYTPYIFSEGKLSSSFHKASEITDDVVVIHAINNIYSGYAGSGVLGYLTIYEKQSQSWYLRKLLSDGSVEVFKEGDWFKIKPGETLTLTTGKKMSMGIWNLVLVDTTTIKNHGFIDKSNILFN